MKKMFCRFCGWAGSIEQAKKREEEHYGRPWVIFSCPRCGADIAYSFKEDVPIELDDDYPPIIKQILKEEKERQELRDRNPAPIENKSVQRNGPGFYPWCGSPFPGWEPCPLKGKCKRCEYPEREHEYFGEKAIYDRGY